MKVFAAQATDLNGAFHEHVVRRGLGLVPDYLRNRELVFNELKKLGDNCVMKVDVDVKDGAQLVTITLGTAPWVGVAADFIEAVMLALLAKAGVEVAR